MPMITRQVSNPTPYVFREYPKHVYPNGMKKPFVCVYSKAQEDAVMKGRAIELKAPELNEIQKLDEEGEVDDSGAPENLSEHAQLLVKASDLGIKADGNWSTKKLKRAIANAKLTANA